MAGIYLHIPFCKRKCHYCDFYKTTDTGKAERYVAAIKREMDIQKEYLSAEQVDTIYFGGGTPSVLTAVQVRGILEYIYHIHSISDSAEITFEANPDDISKIYARDLKRAGINRLSLGIQSWNNDILRMLNRRHSAEQSREAIERIKEAGIDNLSVDLIYGIPGLGADEWEKDLEETMQFDISHLSAYHLTIEEGTVFGKLKKAGELNEIDEEESERQFRELMKKATKKGLIQYEISNFCKEGYYSKHNTNYWRQKKYLGLGPSSHSFDGDSRQWNVSDLETYLQSIEKENIPATKEILDQKDRYNEYIMTTLRTMWGIDLDQIEEIINKESRDYLTNLSERFVKYGMLVRDNNKLVLTDQGKMISDNIISELMMT